MAGRARRSVERCGFLPLPTGGLGTLIVEMTSLPVKLNGFRGSLAGAPSGAVVTSFACHSIRNIGSATVLVWLRTGGDTPSIIY